MDEDLKQLLKSAIESLKQNGTSGGNFNFNYVENRVDNVNEGIGIQNVYYDRNGRKVVQNDGENVANVARPDEPIYSKDNIIFNTKVVSTEGKFITLHNSILQVAVDYGPLAQGEWYYVMKAIKEAGVSMKTGFQVTDFIAQMCIWFPDMFRLKENESEKDMIHRYMKSISQENMKWLEGNDNHEVAIVDMMAHRAKVGYKYDIALREQNIAKDLKEMIMEIL